MSQTLPASTGVLVFVFASLCRTAQSGPPAEMTVEHAAGMFRCQIPADWSVIEYPVGREIRLALSPRPIEPRRRLRLPATHIWFTVHAEVKLPRERLAERLSARAAGPHVTLHEPYQPLRIAGFEGWSIYGMRSPPEEAEREFVHGLVGTPWGIVEFHIESADATFVGQWADRLARQAVIRRPRPTGPARDPKLRAAEPLLGSWKAYRARWRFEPGGRVVLVFDRRQRPTTARPTPVLEGTFHADEDLVKITWRDGSRLHLRWRREGAWLLTTDHEGRVAQLRRIYE